MTIIVSAPGKVHLMGEHAVVYGKPALLAAINKRLTVSVEDGKSGIDIFPRDLEKAVKEHVLHIVSLIQKEYASPTLPSMKITIDSEIPFGYHLGSSAALAVATIGAVVYFVKKLWNPVAINQLAYEAEKRIHGNPSGGDNTVVTMGGFVWFRTELPFLKSIWQLPMKVLSSFDHFLLINTGKPEETTREMVEEVAKRRRDEEAKTEKIFRQNEEQTRRIAIALKERDEDILIDAMKRGERTLEDMGVVSKQAASIIRTIEAYDGTAKILGGGGKRGAVGFLLAYHKDQSIVERLCKPHGYSIEKIVLGEEGIRLDKK